MLKFIRSCLCFISRPSKDLTLFYSVLMHKNFGDLFTTAYKAKERL